MNIRAQIDEISNDPSITKETRKRSGCAEEEPRKTFTYLEDNPSQDDKEEDHKRSEKKWSFRNGSDIKASALGQEG